MLLNVSHHKLKYSNFFFVRKVGEFTQIWLLKPLHTQYNMLYATTYISYKLDGLAIASLLIHTYYFLCKLHCLKFWNVIIIEPALRRGDSVFLVGLSRSLQATSRKSIITNPSAAVNIGSADSPRFRAMNMEVIELDTGKLTFASFLIDFRGLSWAITLVLYMY